MNEISSDYHDYVFKDGKLVGDFEGMYRNSAEVPWHQDRNAYELFSDIDLLILSRYRYRSICDIGSGLGFFSDRLQKELLSPEGDRPKVTGLEVSPTAVKKASVQFPEIRFLETDIIDAHELLSGETFDLLVVKDVLWYVCQKLDRFLESVFSLAGNNREEKGHVYVSQSFPGTESWVGQEVIGSPEELIAQLEKYSEIEYWCTEHDKRWGDGLPLIQHLLCRVR